MAAACASILQLKSPKPCEILQWVRPCLCTMAGLVCDVFVRAIRHGIRDTRCEKTTRYEKTARLLNDYAGMHGTREGGSTSGGGMPAACDVNSLCVVTNSTVSSLGLCAITKILQRGNSATLHNECIGWKSFVWSPTLPNYLLQGDT